jgi:hypothetical protein
MSSEQRAAILMDFINLAESSKKFGKSVMILNTLDRNLDELMELNEISEHFTKLTDVIEDISSILLPLLKKLP